MDLELPELTDEELAEVEGNFEDEPEEESQEPAAEPPVVEKEEVEEKEPEESELDKLKKANAGLLYDLKRTRADGRADRDWKNAVVERMDLLAKKVEGPEEDPDPEPNREEDPVSWLAWQQKQTIKEEVGPLKQNLSEQEQKAQFEEFDQAVRVESKVREDSFLEAGTVNEEEYNSRLDDVRLVVGKQFRDQGMSAKDAVLETSKQERLFTIQCLQNGLNPAEEAMRLWDELKPDRAPWRQKDAPNEAPVDSEAVKKEEPEAKKPLGRIEAAKVGQETAGVGAMSGEGGKTEITADMLADMKEGDPIAEAIYGDETKWYEINVYGKTTV
jgi:hypothetical protein